MSAKILNEKPANKKKIPKRTNKNTIFIAVCVLIAGIVLFYAIDGFKEPPKNTAIARTIPIAPVIVEPYINKAACIDWIFKHSSKISMDMAVDIFETAMSNDYGLLFIALAGRESSLNPSAVSKKGAIGLNQIMPNVWVEELKKNKIIKEKRDLFNYKANLKASHYILLKYYKETGSWEKALKKYVGADSKAYVKDVLANCGELYLLSKSK